MLRVLNCIIAVLVCVTSLAVGARGAVSENPAGKAAGKCQIAVLANGFTLQYWRRQTVGATTRLWLCTDAGATGYLEIASQQIARFEQGESAVPLAQKTLPTTDRGEVPAAGKGIKSIIRNVALRNQIDPDFITSVIKAESGFNPKAISPKGAQGLMQLMPHTAAAFGVEDPFDPAANIEAGTKYLRLLLEQYGGDAAKALAAYNAGPQKVKDFGGIPPYRETRAYVVRVIDDFNAKKLERRARTHITGR